VSFRQKLAFVRKRTENKIICKDWFWGVKAPVKDRESAFRLMSTPTSPTVDREGVRLY